MLEFFILVQDHLHFDSQKICWGYMPPKTKENSNNEWKHQESPSSVASEHKYNPTARFLQQHWS